MLPGRSTSTSQYQWPGLVAQVPEHRAVGLGEADPQLLAVAVVALGQVDGHHARRRARW